MGSLRLLAADAGAGDPGELVVGTAGRPVAESLVVGPGAAERAAGTAALVGQLPVVAEPEAGTAGLEEVLAPLPVVDTAEPEARRPAAALQAAGMAEDSLQVVVLRVVALQVVRRRGAPLLAVDRAALVAPPEAVLASPVEVWRQAEAGARGFEEPEVVGLAAVVPAATEWVPECRLSSLNRSHEQCRRWALTVRDGDFPLQSPITRCLHYE